MLTKKTLYKQKFLGTPASLYSKSTGQETKVRRYYERPKKCENMKLI